MGLIEELRRRQGTKTQMGFAAELGISQSLLSQLYSGKKILGVEASRRILQAFPDLRWDVAKYLLAEDDCEETAGASVA